MSSNSTARRTGQSASRLLTWAVAAFGILAIFMWVLVHSLKEFLSAPASSATKAVLDVALVGFAAAALLLLGQMALAYLSSGRVEELEASAENQIPSSEEDLACVLDALTARVNADLTTEFVRSIDAKYGDAVVAAARTKEITVPFARLRTRLRKEVEALERRGNLNLVTGIGLAIGGFAALIRILAQMPQWSPTTRPTEVAVTQAMRLTLVLFIEVFAFFFLRLYRNSLDGIKYFQNELTNIESRDLALRAALVTGNTEALGRVIDELIRTERNFVIKSGETTVELERLRQEASHTSTLINALGGVGGTAVAARRSRTSATGTNGAG